MEESGLRPGRQTSGGRGTLLQVQVTCRWDEPRGVLECGEASHLSCGLAILDAAQGTRLRVRGVGSLVESGQTPLVPNKLAVSVAIFRRARHLRPRRTTGERGGSLPS